MNIEKYTQKAQEAIIDCQNIAVEEGHQFNSKIIRNEKPLVKRRFKKALRTYNGYIKGTDKLK